MKGVMVIGGADIEFGMDILLDESAFQAATSDLSALSTRLQHLRATIESMLDTLQQGFDTPAGTKFIDSCKNNLLAPLDDQKLVIAHISETLAIARQSYASVFSEYQQLNASIRASGA